MGPYFHRALDASDINEARKRRWDARRLAKQEFKRQHTAKAEGV